MVSVRLAAISKNRKAEGLRLRADGSLMRLVLALRGRDLCSHALRSDRKPHLRLRALLTGDGAELELVRT
jgi:hypothetical protein